jgi:hypothetical protein
VYPSTSENIALDSTYVTRLSCHCCILFDVLSALLPAQSGLIKLLSVSLNSYLTVEQTYVGFTSEIVTSLKFRKVLYAIVQQASPSSTVLDVTVLDFNELLDGYPADGVFSINWEVSVKSGQEVDLRDSLNIYFKIALTDKFTEELNLRGYPEINKSLESPLITTMSETPTRKPVITIRTVQPITISAPTVPASIDFRALKSTEIGVAARIFVTQVSSNSLTCY